MMSGVVDRLVASWWWIWPVRNLRNGRRGEAVGEVVNRDVAGEDPEDCATMEPTNLNAWRESQGLFLIFL
jgi:hypothetical protein